ncbi:MAG: glycosyltransferase family 1 protein, partial [Hyphomicrobiaceae bacterium]
MTNGMNMQHRLCVIHAFDPRGSKVGGIETFIRDQIVFLPDDFDFLMIGIDTVGDLDLGKVTRHAHRGKSFEFMPVLRIDDSESREAAKSIRQSLNFRFLLGMMKHFAAIRR